MASRDVKVLIKTLSDMSGLTRLGKFLHDHSGTVKALSDALQALELVVDGNYTELDGRLTTLADNFQSALDYLGEG
jgi:hypothetical protein